MTILASTENHLVEFEAGLFTIARRTDGHCLAIHKGQVPGVAGNFNSAKRKSRDGVDGAIKRFLRISVALGAEWEPLYKPEKMQ